MFRIARYCALGLTMSLSALWSLPVTVAQSQPVEPALPTASKSNPAVAEIYAQAEGAEQESPSNGFLLANGYAKYVELENDIYIAALYLGTLSSSASAIYNTVAKRMELKIVPARLSYKRFGQQLIKSSAINNSPKSLVDNAEAMEAFLNVFKGNLAQGDHIVLANDVGGFRVSINGIELANIRSERLFNMLLNIWIGNVPPSRDFRARILGGENSAEYKEDFESLSYGTQRIAEIASWKMHQEALADVEKEQKDSLAIVDAASTNDAEPASTAAEKQVEQLASQAKSAQAEQQAKLAAADPASGDAVPLPANSTKAPEKKKQEVASTDRSASSPRVISLDDLDDETSLLDDIQSAEVGGAQAEKLTKSALARAADVIPKGEALPEMPAKQVVAQPEKKAANRKPREKSFSAENLLAVQLYANKLLLHSQRQMRYPKMARRMRQEGKVVASVTIDREGKLVDFELTDESQFTPLNSAVKKGIKRSEPFPQMPDIIDGDDFTFSVPVSFRYSG